MFTFIKKICAGQKKMYITMLCTISLLAGFEFLLLAIYTLNIDNIILRLIPSIAIFASCFLTILINNYFVESKTEEFSIILLSGRNLKQILQYVVIQFGGLFLFAAIMGILLANLFMQAINQVMSFTNQSFHIAFPIMDTIFIYLALFIIKLLFILLFNFGRFTRIKMSIANYMNHVEEKESKPNYFSQFEITRGTKKKTRFPIAKCLSSLFAVFLLVTSITGIINNEAGDNSVFYFAFSLMAEIIIINTTLPLLFNIFHDSFFLKHPVAFMVVTQLIDLSKVMVSMININACLIPIFFSLFPVATLDTSGQTTLIICYFILLGIMLVSFIVRFSVYLPKRANDIATSKALGYSAKNLQHIHTMEMLSFFVFIIALPAVIYSTILYLGYVQQTLSLVVVCLLMGGYLIIYLILTLYMTISYKQITKEVLGDVKYLNRSE